MTTGSASDRSSIEPSSVDSSYPIGSDERRYRKLIENIQDTVTVVDASGSPIWTSAAVKGDLGYVPQFWEQADLFSLVHPDDRHDIEEQLGAILATPVDSANGEVRLRGPDGVYRHVAYGAVNRLSDADIGGIVITARPIDAEVEARQLQTDRQNELETALADRSQWVAGLSHELRSPLHAIIGLTELVRSSETIDRDNLRLVESISQEATALRVMIDSLLDYSKIGANRMDLLAEPFSPAAVLDAVGNSHLAAAAEKGLRLRVEIDPALPLIVLGDEHRLRQIVVNLLTNAIKYTESGSIEVAGKRITKQHQDGDDSLNGHELVAVTVSDTGPGIPEAAFDALFEPYRQVRKTDTIKGTGLGLAITKSLVELMDGTLHFETSERGTTFTCEIPFRRGRRQADQEVVGPRAATPASLISVLVVDDSPVNQMLARSQLDRLGHLAVVVSGGQEALDVLEHQAFDVILMDWHMPGMDGLETTRRIRDSEQQDNHTPIIATTASATSGDRETCIDAGMDDYLPKPIALSDLSSMLERWAGQVGSPEPPDTSVVEKSTLDRLTDELGDPEVVAMVITTFLDELDPRLESIASGVPAGDVDLVRRAAHTLKSNAALLGVSKLAVGCADLEALCSEPTRRPDQLRALAGNIAKEAIGAKRELIEHRDRLLSSEGSQNKEQEQ